MDMYYATIPMFGGEMRRLYREVWLEYIISGPENLDNHPIYAINEYVGSCVLHLDDNKENCEWSVNNAVNKQVGIVWDSIWKMCFDESTTKEGSREWIVLIFPLDESLHFHTN